MIRITGLTKRFGSLCVLDGLELQVERGEWYLFLGPNGAGKTTAIEFQREADRPTGGYSQGMLKKIGLAAALLHQPELLELDEPTGNLDARSANFCAVWLDVFGWGGR